MFFSAIKKVLFYSLFLAVLFTLIPFTTVQAADFRAAEDGQGILEINDTAENLYVAGNTVRVVAPIRKDLVVAAGTIEISSTVERSIMAAGGNIDINSPFVGASVRIAGGNITLEGTFAEDVIIAGGSVTIRDTRIAGDLVVSTGNLILENSQIQGRFIGTYSDVRGNIDEQVAGEVTTYIQEQRENVTQDNRGWNWLRIAQEFSMIIGLLFLVLFLGRRGKLHVPEIRFNSKFGIDILATLGYLILPLFIFILSLIFQVYPIVVPAWIALIMIMILSSLYLPVYIANFIKNVFEIKTGIGILVGITYITLLVLSFIPVVNIIVGLLVFIFFLANFGFVMRKLFATINNSLRDKAEKVSTAKA